MPSSDSMFGMDDESCFLCGGTVFAYESTATSAMMGSCFVADVVGWSRSRVRMRTTVTHDRLMQRRGKLMGCLLSLASATFCLHRHIGIYKLRLQCLVLSVTCREQPYQPHFSNAVGNENKPLAEGVSNRGRSGKIRHILGFHRSDLRNGFRRTD
jgi:hypothetical protein